MKDQLDVLLWLNQEFDHYNMQYFNQYFSKHFRSKHFTLTGFVLSLGAHYRYSQAGKMIASCLLIYSVQFSSSC